MHDGILGEENELINEKPIDLSNLIVITQDHQKLTKYYYYFILILYKYQQHTKLIFFLGKFMKFLTNYVPLYFFNCYLNQY